MNTIFDTLQLVPFTQSVFDILFNLTIAALLGAFIAVVYRLTYKGHSYSSSFVNMLVIITMVTAVVIMVIGNNLARAFGLVGAMSIIRFRTVVKDTRDIAFVFFALACGMATGVGNQPLAIVGVLFVSLIIGIMYWGKFGSVPTNEQVLRFYLMPQLRESESYLKIFDRHLAAHTLLSIRSARMGQYFEASYHIRLKTPAKYQDFVDELSQVEGIERVTIVFNEPDDY